MRVGVQMVFPSWGYDDTVTDGQVVDEELRLAVLAEELGFNALWPVATEVLPTLRAAAS